MLQDLAILAAMLMPALAGDPVAAADTPRKERSLPAIYSYRAADIAALRQGFAAPPREAGPWVFWIFFDNVMSKEEITRELEDMAAAGIAGAELRFLSLHGFSGKPGPGFDPEGWARLGLVGTQISSQKPDFDSRHYGFSKLSSLFEATGLFETRRERGAVHVRCGRPKAHGHGRGRSS